MTALDALEPPLLRSFLVVAEELHFGRAARRLHISQPPLSVQIRKLEERLGVVLFERDRRHVALTEAGRFLADRARHLLSESQRACVEVQRIAHGETGVLAIAYTPTATYEVLPALLPAFRKLHRNVQVELAELQSPLQPEAILGSRFEIGFACGPLPVTASTLRQTTLVREPFVVALPRAHPLCRHERVPVHRLADEPFVIVRPEIEPAWANACNSALAALGIRPKVVQETDSKIALLGLVAAEIGVSLVSASMMHLGRRGVAFRRLRGFPLKVPLVCLSRAKPSPRVAQLLHLAESLLRT